MSVVHADRVDLLFVTLNTVRRTDVVSEEPGLGSVVGTSQLVGNTDADHAAALRRIDELMYVRYLLIVFFWINGSL